MAEKHTTGPWVPEWDVDRHSRLDCIACVEHHIFDAVDIYAPQASATVEEHEANVRLIAAAPEMYGFIEESAGVDCYFYDKYLNPVPCGTCRSCEARKLLARIDGEQA